MQVTAKHNRPRVATQEKIAQLMARVPFIRDVEEFIKVEKQILKLREAL